MIPVIVVALCLGVVAHNSQAEPEPLRLTAKTVVQPAEVEVVEYTETFRHEPRERSTAERRAYVRRSNLETPSTKDYQSLVDRQRDALQVTWSREAKLAHVFMEQYLQRPEVVHSEQFEPAPNGADNYVNAYRKRFNTEDGYRLWQVCAIYAEPGGYIYLSTMLEEDGSIPRGSRGVFISYSDITAMADDLMSLKASQYERFNTLVFNGEEFVMNEEVLRWFLGDADHPYTVNHYLKGLSV